MKTNKKHIYYIAGTVIALISLIPALPRALQYLLALVPILFFGADLTMQYMQDFFNKKYINKYLTGIIVSLGLIVTGRLGFAALAMIFFSAGEYLFDMVLARAGKRIEEASRLTSPYARVLENGKPVRIASASAVPGQMLLVKEGDIVPCDCVVINGEAVLDYTNLLGKGEPRSVKAGAPCFSGGIVQQGNLTVKVIKGAADSMNAVVNAYTKKAAKPSALQKKINRIASLFEIGVYAASLLLFIILMAVTKDFNLAINQSCSILVISALTGVLKVLPILNRNALLCARRRGVVFSDIKALEQCSGIQTVSVNENVSEDVLVKIEETGAIPAKGGHTALDAVLYRDRAKLESDTNPSFKLALGFFSPKAQATALDSKPERIAGAIRSAHNHRDTLKLNLACIATQKLATLALIFLLNINPVTAIVIEFAAWMFCLFNSTKEL